MALALPAQPEVLKILIKQCLIAAEATDTACRVLMVNRCAGICANATARELVNSLSTTVIIIYWNRVGVAFNHIILMVDYIML
ncbi:hypothetical protein NC653_038283 [Populus alba x Populus x berolinensis]|uniref:Uncharacterized protein n=1 Tax=Populus alba x Populus x berolinensis TaxID=444605 RepID=A0AAD6LGB4_9ROSI|nr:hypothetical protein NC653_038283 [Populus alba x Populus x berolinensis]